MRWTKKFWIVFLSFLPFGAGALPMLVVGGIAGLVGIAGFSVYRNVAPVNMGDALNFFSSCWTCQMFSDVMQTMSNLLPGVYSSIGQIVIPVALILTAIWFVWKLVTGFLNAKIDNPWDITGMFTTHFIKLAFVCALLAAPLPRLMTDIVIEPIFNVGLYMNRAVVGGVEFDSCVVSTALADDVALDGRAATRGAYSPQLRYNLACELGTVHQMTGLGMATGWTMLNMAFDTDYMHKIMWGIPIFPNVPVFFAGLLVVVLYLFALLPIPLYFLEIFISLSMDLIMLPLLLLSWLFPNWVLPKGKSIRKIIDDVVSGTLGIAMTGIFMTFSLIFLNAAFGQWDGASALKTAIETNDSHILMDGLLMQNSSLVTVVLMGIFIAMFMTSIPALVKSLFSVNISQDFYNTARKNVTTIWQNVKKLNKFAEK